MKTILLRHAKTKFAWESAYDSAGFDAATAAYEEAGIETATPDAFSVEDRVVYVSSTRRAKETAALLFPGIAVKETPLLNEVPLRSCKDTTARHSLRYWQLWGRLQWWLGSARQPETRKETVARADEVIALIERESKDVILLSHGFFLLTLLKRLRAKGYVLTRGNVGPIEPLERIRATRRADHCGACTHNCSLKHPGCGVGIDKARREGYEYSRTS